MLLPLGTLLAALAIARPTEYCDRSLREEDSTRVGVPLLCMPQQIGCGAAGRAAAGFDAGNPARRKLRRC